VEGCYAYYAENGYEPGNPEDGEWEDAHYPVPRCEGGEVTIKLLKQHHAVQGVLQSEEYQRPCIWGWEANYLQGEMLALYKKWRSELGRRSQTPEQRSASVRAYLATLTPEERRARALRGAASQTPEQRRATALKAAAAQTPEQRREARLKGAAAQTPEQRSEAARLGRARMTPEQRRAIALKAAETKRRKREAAMLQSVTAP
jgi:hypothetical protein